MKFRILGPLEVLSDGRPLQLGGQKQRVLLSLLLLGANQVVSRDRLIEALWGEQPTATAGKALQVYVSQLRKVLGKERLETKAPGYLVRVEPGELDLATFRRLHAEAKLREALAMWRGPALADLAHLRFAQVELARLEESRLTCLEERIDRDLDRGADSELVGELEALVAQHPLRERPRAQLMLCLYRSGRQAEALEAYQAARSVLVGELGIEPNRALRDLHQAILEQDSALDIAAPAEPAAGALHGAFVGRGAELSELVAALDEALAGRGRLFLLAGEPGIGKSRLAEELSTRASVRGARVIVGRCWEAGGAPAYWPWVQALRTYVRECDAAALRSQLGRGAADLAQIVPELRDRFPDLPGPPSLESEGARFRLFDATVEFFRNASASRPMVLVLDDLHAADAPSLLLLQFLARELHSTRLLVLGVHRTVDPVPGRFLTDMLAEAAREPATRRLSLRGLTERDVVEYVQATAPEISSNDLGAKLHEQTDGNPLFVGEVMRLLKLEGLGSEQVPLSVPQSVRDVIARRLAHLSGECNQLLVLGSVIGREFALDALAHVAGVSQNELLGRLDEAMNARVLLDVPGGSGNLRFGHVLIRDTLYDGLTSARRLGLHRRVAEMLAAHYGEDSGPHLAELAHHFIAGRDFVKGLDYAWRSGDRALSLLAYEEAARLYVRALEALDRADPADHKARCELLLMLGEAEARAGDGLAAKRTFVVAAELAQRSGLAVELGRAAAGYGGRWMAARAGDDARLVPLLEQGLMALGDHHVQLRARLLARLAGALRDEPLRDRRDRLSKEAIELARRADDPVALAYALDGRVAAIIAADTVDECSALATELLRVSETLGNAGLIVRAYSDRCIAHVMAGDLAGAQADLEAAGGAADELRQPDELWQVDAGRAMLALGTGRLADAQELMVQAFVPGERAQPEMAIPIHGLQRYMLADLRDRLIELDPIVRELVGEFPARPAFRCVLAHLHARLGRLNEASQTIDDLVREGLSALPSDMEGLFGMSLLAESAAIVKDAATAETLYAMLLPWRALNAVDYPEGMRGSVSRYLGLLATTIKRWKDAEKHFQDAAAFNATMGAWPWLARTEDDYAQMLLARDAPGDREHAAELLPLALETYRKLGMEGYEARASALADALGYAA